MNRNNIIFWIATVITAVMMLYSAYAYLTSPQITAAFIHLGYPGYFRVELAVLKILGAIVLLVPNFSQSIRQLAYFGFALTFLSAFIAHISSGDPVSVAIMPILFLAVLSISYFSYLKLYHPAKQLVTI